MWLLSRSEADRLDGLGEQGGLKFRFVAVVSLFLVVVVAAVVVVVVVAVAVDSSRLITG